MTMTVIEMLELILMLTVGDGNVEDVGTIPVSCLLTVVSYPLRFKSWRASHSHPAKTSFLEMKMNFYYKGYEGTWACVVCAVGALDYFYSIFILRERIKSEEKKHT